MKNSDVYVANQNIVDADIGGERALLHLDSNTYFTLNPTASEVWMALSEKQSVDTLVNVLTEKFEVSAEQCKPDVELMLSEMVAANIVEKIQAEKAG